MMSESYARALSCACSLQRLRPSRVQCASAPWRAIGQGSKLAASDALVTDSRPHARGARAGGSEGRVARQRVQVVRDCTALNGPEVQTGGERGSARAHRGARRQCESYLRSKRADRSDGGACVSCERRAGADSRRQRRPPGPRVRLPTRSPASLLQGKWRRRSGAQRRHGGGTGARRSRERQPDPYGPETPSQACALKRAVIGQDPAARDNRK